MKFVTDRVRVFLFGIVIAFMGLINPSWALRKCHEALDI